MQKIFSITMFLFALVALWLNIPFNQRNPWLINDLRLFKALYNCRDTFTDVMSPLQIKLFMQNKAKFRKSQMNVNKVLTKGYEKKTLSERGKKQSQTNPNKAKLKKAKMNVNKVLAKNYENKPPIRAPKKQSQTSKRQKPMQPSLPQRIMKKTGFWVRTKQTQNKPKSNPNKPNFKGKKRYCCICRLAFLLEIMISNCYIWFLRFVFCSVGGSLKRSLGIVLARYALRDTRCKKWLCV